MIQIIERKVQEEKMNPDVILRVYGQNKNYDYVVSKEKYPYFEHIRLHKAELFNQIMSFMSNYENKTLSQVVREEIRYEIETRLGEVIQSGSVYV